ncbi:exosortase T [Terricaulis sp.]|uniref:exosortase T n=1 Tax=Terricaulis sp. TaxID=2768686 RepID=UPI00378493CB
MPRDLDWSRIAFAVAVAILAAHPVLWLINTWLDPAFDSHGFAYFAVMVVLAGWSFTSPLSHGATESDKRVAFGLLAATALVRLAGQVLAIDTIGALALVIDVYALARLAGLHRRVRAVSPFFLAAAFAFALPLERIVQRLIGYGLQDISARGACGVLSAAFGDVQCAGVRISVQGADVLVDLPCSGARAIIVFGFLFTIAAALARPRFGIALLGGALALAAALIGNVIRISLLASGVAIGPDALGFDVMAQPWHDIVDLVALGLVAPIVVLWARHASTRSDVAPPVVAPKAARASRPRLWTGAACILIAAAIVTAPRRPIDVVARDISIAAPERIGAYRGAPLPLTARERAYFEQYGGAAVKSAYGPYALMLARTSSPLRHLHAPDECLRGLGYDVTYLGMRYEPAPSAIYRAVAPDGRAYRVEVSFQSSSGHTVASVSEAVWLWLTDRSTVWTAIQRIAPEGASASDQAAFEAGVFAALDQPQMRPAQFAAGGGNVR